MKCNICDYWTPLNGCKHFLPDSKTLLEANGYTVTPAPAKDLPKRVKVTSPGIIHYFDSVAKAAHILIHEKKRVIKKTKIEGSSNDIDNYNIIWNSETVIKDKADQTEFILECNHWKNLGAEVIEIENECFFIAEGGELKWKIDLI